MNFKFPSDENYEVDKVVVIEKFESKLLEKIENKNQYKNKKNGFCNNIGMDKKCGNFDNKTACTSIDCCVWAKNKKTVLIVFPETQMVRRCKKIRN